MTKMLYLYTVPPTFAGICRLIVKKVLHKERGPEAVLRSLERGLHALRVPYTVNKNLPAAARQESVHVIAGADTVRWALAQKAKGHIGYLSVGPAIVVLPSEEQGLLKDRMIDKILCPSEWTRQLYVRTAPSLRNKIKVWPAGVQVPSHKKRGKRSIDLLILDKRKDPALTRSVRRTVQKAGLAYKVLTYGHFSQKRYYALLQKCKAMLYIGRTESQGLALLEAWVRDVPTLVYEDRLFTYQGMRWPHASSAPYLTKETGSFFKDDLEPKLARLLKSHFSPKTHCLEHWTDKIIAKHFLELLPLQKKGRNALR